MKSPKMPKQQQPTTLPDLTSASVAQSKFDALQEALKRRGRSSTLLTWNKQRGPTDPVSGRLADIMGGRTQTQVNRGGV